MKLTEILGENEITIDLEAEDKWEAIEELIDVMISEHEVSLRDRDYIIDVINQREKSMSTGVGNGVAIPHGTVDCVDAIIGALGISARGINWDAIDGKPVHIVLILLVPKTKIGKHIKTLANTARTFGQKEICRRITAAKSPAEVLEILKEAEAGTTLV